MVANLIVKEFSSFTLNVSSHVTQVCLDKVPLKTVPNSH
jgi:hypothetical protein